ncbi:MAG TPA: IS110 family transposase [Burkholderiaceae bacterium]|nr:IS110 family transposase [Burkholderiaceae bacterium]
MDRTVGLDVGDRETHFCILDETGEILEQGRFRSTRAGLEGRFRTMPRARVVLEVGALSPWMSRDLEAFGHEVLVANSYQMGRIYKGQDKSDRHDAQTLARLGRSDPKLLKPLQHRRSTAMIDRGLLHAREILVRSRVQLINHVRGSVKTVGARVASSGTAQFAKNARSQIPAALQDALGPILDTIQVLTDQIRTFDRQIEAVAERRYPEVEHLRTVHGVGPLTAFAFVLSIDDPSRFAKSRTVGSYLGLRPKKHQSGDADPQLRISRAGDPQLRRLLVQCAHHVLGPFGEDSDLRRFGLRLIDRGGRFARKRAIVAVARKLAVLLHRLWITGEDYEPLRLANRQAA